MQRNLHRRDGGGHSGVWNTSQKIWDSSIQVELQALPIRSTTPLSITYNTVSVLFGGSGAISARILAVPGLRALKYRI
jgi:hypothetical protein